MSAGSATPCRELTCGWGEHPLIGQSLSAPAGTRTPNQLIKSQLLYQLSYGGICVTKNSNTGQNLYSFIRLSNGFLNFSTDVFPHPLPR